MKVKAVEVDNLGQENMKITPVETNTEPTEPNVPTEPTEPQEPVEPTEPPVEPVEPSEPTEPTEPVDPNEPVEPTEPTLTDELVNEFIKEKYKIDSLEEFIKTKNEAQLPEDVDKFLKWRDEKGGGTLEEFITVTKDWSKASDTEIISNYMKLNKPHLEADEISFEIDRMFSYDAELDSESDVMAKKIAKKDYLKSAIDYFENSSKNYKPSRLDVAEIPAEFKEAVEFKKTVTQQTEAERLAKEKQHNAFKEQTEKFFSDKFEGFEFKVGEEASTVYKPSNVDNLRESNADLSNMLKKYVNEDGSIKDVAGYHRAITIASDPDAFATYFFEEGKASGVEEVVNTSKNRSQQPRSVHTKEGGTESKVRSVDIGHSDYKFKLKVKK